MLFLTAGLSLTDPSLAQADQFRDLEHVQDPWDALWEAPIEVKIEQQLTVVLCTGGPHVEATATITDSGITNARLQGWWGPSHQSWEVTDTWPLWGALEQYAEALR